MQVDCNCEKRRDETSASVTKYRFFRCKSTPRSNTTVTPRSLISQTNKTKRAQRSPSTDFHTQVDSQQAWQLGPAEGQREPYRLSCREQHITSKQRCYYLGCLPVPIFTYKSTLIAKTVETRRPQVSPSIDFVDKSTPRAPILANRLDETNPSVTLHRSLHRSHHHSSSNLANCQDKTNASVARHRF